VVGNTEVDAPSLMELCNSATTQILVGQTETNWYPCNPSIAQGPDGYAAIVTFRNIYRHTGTTQTIHDPNGYIHTRNFFAQLSPDTLHAVEPWRELAGPSTPIHFASVQGIEDPRLYWHNGWRYTGTILQHHASGEHRVAVCDVEHGLLEIREASAGTIIKNQMPTGGEPEFIDAKACEDRLHGGAVVRNENGYLGIVHEVRWPGRVYVHRLARFDRTGKLLSESRPFKLSTEPIDFASGIVLHKDDLVISFGVMDRQALLVRIPFGESKGLFA